MSNLQILLQAPIFSVQLLIDGLLVGAIFALVAWGLYRAVIWRVVDRDLFISLLATFGLSILIQQLANQVFGANVETARSGLGTISLFGGSVTVAEIKLVAFAATFVVA